MKYSLLLTLFACGPSSKSTTSEAEAEQAVEDTEAQSEAEETSTETDDSSTDTETDEQVEEITIDNFEDHACTLQNVDAPTISLAVSESEAGQVLMLPSRTEGFWLQREEGQEGWMTIEVAGWMELLHLNTQPGISFEVVGGDIISERDNEICPDELQYQLVTFHEWGSYVVHFAADGPATFWFSIVKQ